MQSEVDLYKRTTNPEVNAEIERFEAEFDGLTDQFELLDKIGEGTFSFVYRAIDLWSPTKKSLVAVKRIHATSSPRRIYTELDILSTLKSSPHICEIVTVLRCRDQVLLVMPCINFTDFRYIYMSTDLGEMRSYMSELLKALAFTASKGVIHRDVKPTNFLYDIHTKRGVLVDFGLAEYQQEKGNCTCRLPRIENHTYKPRNGYIQDDTRPPRRANRAGTRGFRPPEVLLKCNRQDHKIDVWAAGVVLLMLLTRRFPFFNSLDDADALVEMATIFGRREMRQVSLLHNCVFETNIPTISEERTPWAQLIDWSREERVREDNPEESNAIDLLDKMMTLDCRQRLSAAECLQHEFFSDT